MNRGLLLSQLAQIQSLLLALVEDADEISCRRQYHPDLSPLGWHLGHCVFIECLWLHEKIRGDNGITRSLTDFYTPPHTPKCERGKLLPAKNALLAWAQELQAFNLQTLGNLYPQWREHPLLKDDFIIHFLIQHASQHYETMLMILTQKAVREFRPEGISQHAMQAMTLRREAIDVPAGYYRIGGERPAAYDNEVPPQQAELGPFAIGKHPVSNAEYLAFMQDDGYRRKGLWGKAGWSWRQQHNIVHPDHWRQNKAGDWYAIGMRGGYELAGTEPVSGINHYEATAFARWANGRLPHEYQWEAACRIGVLEQTGRVWEWCDNTFHPYEGFSAFPYSEYSQPWFDGQHYSLRGGSLHTRPAIKRPSFRNFFYADKRHIFAGLRLTYQNP